MRAIDIKCDSCGAKREQRCIHPDGTPRDRLCSERIRAVAAMTRQANVRARAEAKP